MIGVEQEKRDGAPFAPAPAYLPIAPEPAAPAPTAHAATPAPAPTATAPAPTAPAPATARAHAPSAPAHAEYAAPAGPRTPASLIDLLLRDRPRMLAQLRTGADPRPVLATMVAAIAVAMAIVGAALGSYRGGAQIAYAAVKLPIVLLATAALSAPVLSAVSAALGRRSRLSADLALVMSALAFGALLMAACTPLILLARALELEYHRMITGTVLMFAAGGCAALWVVVQGVSAERGPGWLSAVASLCCVFALVGGQLSWALRPYLVRPRTPEVPFLRAMEGSLFDAIHRSIQSAQGIYARERDAPGGYLPGERGYVPPARRALPPGEPAKEPAAIEPAKEPAIEPAKEPAIEPALEPAIEPAKEPEATPQAPLASDGEEARP